MKASRSTLYRSKIALVSYSSNLAAASSATVLADWYLATQQIGLPFVEAEYHDVFCFDPSVIEFFDDFVHSVCIGGVLV